MNTWLKCACLVVLVAVALPVTAAELDLASIEALTGLKGKFNEAEGVFKVTFPRTDIKATVTGVRMNPELGLTAWAAFAGSDELAVVDGDFAMIESEVQGVLKALRAGGIDIVAIHNHMTFENPRMVFLHYWGIGSTGPLARALRAALDTQRVE